MASLESLLGKTYTAQPFTGRTVDDKSVALELIHVSSNATPSVTVVSNTGITLADAGYTTGSLAFGVYTNLGLLADKINNSYNLYWKARIMDGLRSTSTASSVLIPNGVCSTVTQGSETIYQVFQDHSVGMSLFYRVAMDRGVLYDDDARLKTTIPNDNHRVKILGITYNANVNAAMLNGVRIYEFDPVAVTETEIWSAKSVDATATTLDFTDSPITSGYGNELIVQVTDGTSLTDDIANFLEVNYIRE
jgi:hypothetical protein